MLKDKIKAVVPELTDADFVGKVILQDDGSGPYIKEWNLAKQRPTAKELADAKPEKPAKADPVALLVAFLRANPDIVRAIS